MTKFSGTTLIEILISLLLMSIILFGLDAVQISSLQQLKVNYYLAAAEQQINNMVERLSVNASNLETWNKENEDVLPEGRGVITGNIISIFWGKGSEDVCKAAKINTKGCLQFILP